MRDHTPNQPLDLLVVDQARVALAELTEEQRLALVIEMINGATEVSSCLHLVRIEALALQVGSEIARAEFIEKEMRKCL